MKRALILILAMLIVVTIVGCGARSTEAKNGSSLEWWQQLIGVVIGGLIAALSGWLVAKRSFTWQRETELNIRRKEEIYGPIYTELKQMQVKLSSIPRGFGIVVDELSERKATDLNPRFMVWVEMKNTAKHLDVPKELHERLDAYVKQLVSYNVLLKDVDSFTAENLPSIYEELDIGFNPYDGKRIWKIRLLEDELQYEMGEMDLTLNQAQAIFERIRELYLGSGIPTRMISMNRDIESETNALASLFEQDIDYIIKKYEERKMWFKRHQARNGS